VLDTPDVVKSRFNGFYQEQHGQQQDWDTHSSYRTRVDVVEEIIDVVGRFQVETGDQVVLNE